MTDRDTDWNDDLSPPQQGSRVPVAFVCGARARHAQEDRVMVRAAGSAAVHAVGFER